MSGRLIPHHASYRNPNVSIAAQVQLASHALSGRRDAVLTGRVHVHRGHIRIVAADLVARHTVDVHHMAALRRLLGVQQPDGLAHAVHRAEQIRCEDGLEIVVVVVIIGASRRQQGSVPAAARIVDQDVHAAAKVLGDPRESLAHVGRSRDVAAACVQCIATVRRQTLSQQFHTVDAPGQADHLVIEIVAVERN